MRTYGIQMPHLVALIGFALATGLASASGPERDAPPQRQWTIYLAQDKHLDYNWCGSTTAIELRMAALVDYYLDLVERVPDARWNLDSTLWLEVYRRHRGAVGAERLLKGIKDGRIGYAGNREVSLWGMMSTELAIRACQGALPIEQAAGVPARTALVMENPGMSGGAAAILTQCGFAFLGRGIYALRAESYLGQRQPLPLFWWQAPGGRRILVRWDLYADTNRGVGTAKLTNWAY